MRYLSSQDEVIFHGSNNPNIDTFAPVRKSYELIDETGRGNLQAVYGTHDGLWPMFFAVFDRSMQIGSIRNGVLHFENSQGHTLAVYQFSVNQELLPQNPWCDGMVYLLPREKFNRLELTAGVPSNEWASEAPVRPLARLPVKPEDFPFLNRVQISLSYSSFFI